MNIKKYSKYLSWLIFVLGVVFTFVFFLQFYPLKNKDIIKDICFNYGVKPEVIASLINAESSFNPLSKSSKGAIGLMQILPSTAKWVCENEGIKFEENRLFDVSYNITLGTSYFSYLLDKFDNLGTAIVAYNAGEGNVVIWLKNNEYSLDGKSLQKIPFKESENYLRRVKRAIGVYKLRFIL